MKPGTDRTLGQNLSRMRERLGLSQGDLGKAVGVSRQAVMFWECGGGMRVAHLLELCAVLACRPSALLPPVPSGKKRLALARAASVKRLVAARERVLRDARRELALVNSAGPRRGG